MSIPYNIKMLVRNEDDMTLKLIVVKALAPQNYPKDPNV